MAGSIHALDDATLAFTFAASLAAGALHAIAGPDHVAAVVALIASARRERAASRSDAHHARDDDDDDDGGGGDGASLWRACAKQGFRWALGHALGLGAVTAVFFACARRVDVDRVAKASDFVVGVTMLALGLANIRAGVMFYRRERRARAHVEDCEARGAHEGASGESDGTVVVVAGSEAHRAAHAFDIPHAHAVKGDRNCDDEVVSEPQSLWRRMRAISGDGSTREGRLAAYGVGFTHGVSGLSGVVYVLPAVFLRDTSRVIMYMFGFFFTSTLAMTMFAAILGAAPGGGRRSAIALQCVGGVSVLVVGAVWIALTATNELNL